MSSKIYRDNAAQAAHPIEWRRHGALVSLRPQPAERPAQQDEDLETRVAAAYQQGVAAGEAAATQRAQARLDPVLTGFGKIVQELSTLRRRFRAEAEESTVALAIAIAKRVLHREINSDPEAILGLVKAAFQKCDARELHKLRLSPADAAVVQENRSQLGLPPGLEIQGDAGLVRGAAIFETTRGDLDASMQSQIGEIERGFADILTRRNH
jgi:flagellar assembly protein FliH